MKKLLVAGLLLVLLAGGLHAGVPAASDPSEAVDLSWKPYTTFSSQVNGFSRQRASVSVDPDGMIHIAQLTGDYKIIYFNSRLETRGPNGFSDPIIIDAADISQFEGVGFPDIWADTFGKVHIVWDHQYTGPSPNFYSSSRIGHCTILLDGSQNFEWLNDRLDRNVYTGPQVAVSETGVVHVVVQHFGPSPVNTRPEHAVVQGGTVSFNAIATTINSSLPRFSVRGDHLCAVWEDTQEGGVHSLSYSTGTYASQSHTVSWQGRQTIPGTDENDRDPDVDLDYNNNAHFSWWRNFSSSPAQVMYFGPGGGVQQVTAGGGIGSSGDFAGPARVRAWDNKVHVFYKGMSHAEKIVGSGTWKHEEPIKAPNTNQVSSPGPDEVSVFRGRFDLVDATHHVRTYDPLPEGASWVPAFPGASVNIVPLNGNFQFRLNLFSTKGVAPCTSLGLTYNTKQAIGSYTGASWTMDHLMHVTPGGDDQSVTLTMPDGLTINFTFDPASGYNIADKGFGFVASIQKIGATWKMIADGGTEYNFDTSGKLNTVFDPSGNFLTVNYTGGRPTSIVDQLGNGGAGRTTQLIYGTNADAGHVVQVIDPGGKSYRLNYSGTYSGSQLTSVVFEGDPSFPTYQFEYGTNGLMSKVILPEGSANGNYGYQIFYDGAGRVEHIEDPVEYYLMEGAADDGVATPQSSQMRFVYNDTASVTSTAIGNGKFCTRVINRRHAVSTQVPPPVPTDLDFSTVSVFDAANNFGLIEFWDTPALAHVAGIHPILREFDNFGNVRKMTDRWGFDTLYSYYPPSPATPWLTNLVQSVSKPNPSGSGSSLVESFTYTSDFFGNVKLHTTVATPTGSTSPQSRTTTYDYDAYGRVTSILYPNVTRPDTVQQTGVETTNVYGGPRRQLSQTINAEQHSTFYSDFDSRHGLPRMVTRDGGTGADLTTYDAMGNVTSTQRPQGAPGNDPTFATVYGLDGLYRVATVMDPNGSITTNVYDHESRLVSVRPPAGSATTTVYDRRGFVTGGTTPDGSWSQVVDANGNVRQKRSLTGGYTYTAYDSLDRVIRNSLPGTSITGLGGGPDRVTLRSYELVDDTTAERFSLETRVGVVAPRVTRTVYDNRQRAIRVTAPDGLTVTETFYDEQDQVVASQLKYSTVIQTATLTYRDARDRVDHVRIQDKAYLDPAVGNHADTYTIFNKVGSVVQTVDPLGNPAAAGFSHKTTMTLDARERISQITDGTGVVVRENFWGDDDLLIEVRVPDPATKAAGRATSETRTYTARKELKTVLNRNGVGLTYAYNAIQGQVDTVSDAQNRVTKTTYYSDTQRVDTVTVAFGAGLDASGLPQSRQTKSMWTNGLLSETVVWNPSGSGSYSASYKYFYDHGDRLELFRAPLVSQEQHFYNEFGEESTFIAGNKTIDFFYNSLGQLITKVWSGPVYNKTETRTYNEIGLLQTVANALPVAGALPPGTLSKQMFYDNWHGTLSTEIFITGNSGWKSQSHVYDVAKNYIGLVDSQVKSHEWTYDENNRVKQIRYDGKPVCEAFYTPGGLVDKTTLYDATGAAIADTTHRYDGLGRKTGQETVALATHQSTAAFEWEYDSLDLVTAIKVNHLGVRADLQYNLRRELTQEAWSGNNGGQNAPLPDPTVQGSALPSNPQSTPSNEARGQWASALAVGAVTKAYTYDPAGNRKTLTIGTAVTTCTYNDASQLTHESTPSVSAVDHFYDEWGNETSRTTTPSGGSAVTETYIYNYLNLLSDYQKPGAHWQYDYWPTGERYAKTNLNNSNDNELYVSRFGDVVTEYSNPTTLKNSYAQGTGVDSKCTRIPATGGRKHYLGDSVGTVSVTLTDTASVSETTLKDAWGVAFPGTSSSERYGYAQREHDQESGLVHMRARQYDPKLGRFSQSDPVLGNKPFEQYIYASNRPSARTDPLGLDDDEVVGPVRTKFDATAASRREAELRVEQHGENKSTNENLTETYRKQGPQTPVGQTPGMTVVEHKKDVQAESFRDTVIKTSNGNIRVRKSWGLVIFQESVEVAATSLAPVAIGEAALEIYRVQRAIKVTEQLVQASKRAREVGRAFQFTRDILWEAQFGEIAADAETVVYQKVGPNGEHLKFGIAKNEYKVSGDLTRYSDEALGGGRTRILAGGDKKDMLKLERYLHENMPRGPEEGQQFYVRRQLENGYLQNGPKAFDAFEK